VSLDRYKKAVWRWAVRVHDDARVAGFLRALSVVGMVGGMTGFVVGINPLFAILVSPQFPLETGEFLRLGVLGLLVYSVSLTYYNATSPTFTTDDGLIRI
jgi:hypothetical protein